MTPHDPDHLPLLEAMALDSDHPLEALAASDQADCAECRTELEEHLRVERLLDTNEADFRADLARGRALDQDDVVGRGSAAAVLGGRLPSAPDAAPAGTPRPALRLVGAVAALAAAVLLAMFLLPDPEPRSPDDDPMLGNPGDAAIELIEQPTLGLAWPEPPTGGWSDVEIRTLDGELLLEVSDLETGFLGLDGAQSAAWPNEIEVRVRTFEASTSELPRLRSRLRLP